jgi:hypothetical protein
LLPDFNQYPLFPGQMAAGKKGEGALEFSKAKAKEILNRKDGLNR